MREADTEIAKVEKEEFHPSKLVVFFVAVEVTVRKNINLTLQREKKQCN